MVVERVDAGIDTHQGLQVNIAAAIQSADTSIRRDITRV